MSQSRNREGRFVRSLMLQLAWFLDVGHSSFNSERDVFCKEFFKKNILSSLGSFFDFFGILFIFFNTGKVLLHLWLWACHLSSMPVQAALLLTWLASLSSWIWNLHKNAFYMRCVQSCQFVGVWCHKTIGISFCRSVWAWIFLRCLWPDVIIVQVFCVLQKR